jgi:hypothetical protein
MVMNRFTIWVVDAHRTAVPHVDVYDARSVTEAMEQALQRVAREWACDPVQLAILGVAEGDLRTLDRQNEVKLVRRQEN